MSKYEIENLKDTYIYNNTKETKGVCFPNNEKAITEVIDAFCECVDFEKPDGYCVYENVLYLFEHFSIDASIEDKGSSYMRLKRHMQERDNKFKNSNKEVLVSSINVAESLEDYIKNFRKIVKGHYEKIDSYIENIKMSFPNLKYREIKVVFVGENPMPLGVRLIQENSVVEMIPLFYRNFIYDLKKYSKIDYFLFFSHGLNSDFITGLDMKYIEEDYKMAMKVNRKSEISSDYFEIVEKVGKKNE